MQKHLAVLTMLVGARSITMLFLHHVQSSQMHPEAEKCHGEIIICCANMQCVDHCACINERSTTVCY